MLVDGTVILAQRLLGWAKADASRDALQFAPLHLHDLVSICLIGAWVGFTLRQIGHADQPGPQSLRQGQSNL